MESITVTSSTSARLFQCPKGPNFLRDPSTGEPQYQADAPCQNVKLHDVDFTLTTQRKLAGTGAPTFTILAVVNGIDCEISDSSLVNQGGGAISLANGERFYLLRNTLFGGSSQVSPFAPEPLSDSARARRRRLHPLLDARLGHRRQHRRPGTGTRGAGGTMGIEYDAHDLYIADNTFEDNLTDYGEGFSFDAPY